MATATAVEYYTTTCPSDTFKTPAKQLQLLQICSACFTPRGPSVVSFTTAEGQFQRQSEPSCASPSSSASPGSSTMTHSPQEVEDSGLLLTGTAATAQVP